MTQNKVILNRRGSATSQDKKGACTSKRSYTSTHVQVWHGPENCSLQIAPQISSHKRHKPPLILQTSTTNTTERVYRATEDSRELKTNSRRRRCKRLLARGAPYDKELQRWKHILAPIAAEHLQRHGSNSHGWEEVLRSVCINDVCLDSNRTALSL